MYRDRDARSLCSTARLHSPVLKWYEKTTFGKELWGHTYEDSTRKSFQLLTSDNHEIVIANDVDLLIW